MDKHEIFCNRYGFVADPDKDELIHLFNNGKFKMVHIETYLDNPYTLLSRVLGKNVFSKIENKRIIIYKKHGSLITTISNIPIESIDSCVIKQYNDVQYEIIFTVCNINCSLVFILRDRNMLTK